MGRNPFACRSLASGCKQAYTSSMELSPWAALFVVVLATTFFLKAIPFHDCRRTYNLPPDPKPWPIIGNLNLCAPQFFNSVCFFEI
ncbi:flavonoid 3-monooxygenase [Panicum miliaceum]|uniref:Flavonoid 3-monooxygenase n=1 Tax=Panicum miliaceum TaxID=4540 RepID=A0A3L6T7E3_PANMI|nr:flavonoid 3-monooxygenase [Panicum miliaceum]